MKFGRYLDKEAVPEWRKKYLNYRYLKDILRETPLNAPERVESEQFFTVLNAEFDKIERFYRQHEMDMIQKCNMLLSQAPNTRLRKALLHTYADLDLIRSYRSLNLQAFFKICKKYDKVTQSSQGGKYYEMVRSNSMWSSPVLDELSAKIEVSFQSNFAGGDRHKAMHYLRLKDLKHRHFHGAALLAGFLWGSCGVLLWNIFSSCLITPKQRTLAFLFAGQALPLLLAGLFFVNVLGYNAAFINYRFIFGFEQRSAIHECQYLAMIGGFSLIFILTAYLVLLNWSHIAVFSLLPLLITLSAAGIPAPILWPHSRSWIARIGGRLLAAPFVPVRFADFFVADEMCSLTITWQCLAWTILYCFNPEKYADLSIHSFFLFLIPILPFAIRFLQCWRRFRDTGIKFNLLNAFKYSLSIVAFTLRMIYCLASSQEWLVSTADLFTAMAGLFSLYWDLVMDFGLLQSREFKTFLLRSQLAFSPIIIYYLIIAYDCFARLVFVWPLFLRLTDAPKPSYLLLIWGMIELFRRFLWNFLRLEYEHLNNCDAFRALHDLDLPQIRTADLYYRVEDESPSSGDDASEEVDEEEFEESEVFSK